MHFCIALVMVLLIFDKWSNTNTILAVGVYFNTIQAVLFIYAKVSNKK